LFATLDFVPAGALAEQGCSIRSWLPTRQKITTAETNILIASGYALHPRMPIVKTAVKYILATM
jgi:hypothetical protein